MANLHSRAEKRSGFLRFFSVFIIFIACFAFAAFLASTFVVKKAASRIISPEAAAETASYDCIIVLGCGVYDDHTPSPLLRHRLDTAIALYQRGAAPKLLMSGDHGRKDYNEVQVMKNYAMEKGVPSSDIFMDHAGFSTYESFYRADAIFQVKHPLIVTQKYHLYRAIYLASAFSMDADGVDAGMLNYGGQWVRDSREIIARAKDLLFTILRPKPKYLGDVLPISGDGDLTND